MKLEVNENNVRLDVYLTKNTELSRTKIQKLIKEGNVLVNNVVCSANYKVKENDIIEIENICLENKVPVIAISSNPISPIAKAANILLQSATDELTYRSESMPSRVSQYCIINALFVTSMLRDQDNSTRTIDTIHKTLSKIEKNK